MTACFGGKDFNFVLEWGGGVNYRVDTSNGTLGTKESFEIEWQTIDFVIPDKMMQSIHDKFAGHNIDGLPDDVSEEDLTRRGHARYFFTYGARTIFCQEVNRKDSASEEHKRFLIFVDFIAEYIYATEEFENLVNIHRGE